MTDVLRLADAILGGPGLDGYAYNADIYCVDCGREITFEVYERREDEPIPYPDAQDSSVLPQPIFFGESEIAQHCAVCGELLYGGEES